MSRQTYSFWDTVLPLIQGNRRERQLQRKQGGLLPEDYERVQRDQRRDEMLAAQSSTGDMLVEDAMDAPEFRDEDIKRRASEEKRQRRLQRKRWGGTTELGGEEKAEHKYSTAVFRISPRKLNLLANQIIGKPIDFAIVQMQFSAKRAARRVKATLVMARDHAEAKGLDPSSLVVSEAWVTKGMFLPRLDIKGRARMGIMHHPKARLNVVLRPGKTWEQRDEARLEKARRQVRSLGSGGVVRGSPKIVNGFQRPGWAW
ncbi:mitochondrial large ribosomal subunit [Malassezia pachydermatis]